MEEKRIASKAPKKPSQVKLIPKDELSFAGEHPPTSTCPPFGWKPRR